MTSPQFRLAELNKDCRGYMRLHRWDVYGSTAYCQCEVCVFGAPDQVFRENCKKAQRERKYLEWRIKKG